uniref:Uncharacterized protein n=1 Tax=Arion vulgaris TaxID=1028688 RepID=A0A0B7AHN6_9EUPU
MPDPSLLSPLDLGHHGFLSGSYPQSVFETLSYHLSLRSREEEISSQSENLPKTSVDKGLNLICI